MIHSMTAFARAEKTENSFFVVTEIRSYNSRYLDIVLHIPYNYSTLEEKIKKLISAKLQRGRVEIKVQINDDSGKEYAFEINKPLAQSYYNALMQIKDLFAIDTKITIDNVLRVDGILKPVAADNDENTIWPVLKSCISKALDDLVEMRKKEGSFIFKDFINRLELLTKYINEIDRQSVNILNYHKERLLKRIAIFSSEIKIDPDKIAREAVIFVEKSDVTEELVRSKSHIDQFYATMHSKKSAGRRLIFLLQELNREFNTIGSKTEKAKVSHLVVDMKLELEKIKEQVQNIE